MFRLQKPRLSCEGDMITLKEIVIVVASATAVIAVGYVSLIGLIVLTA